MVECEDKDDRVVHRMYAKVAFQYFASLVEVNGYAKQIYSQSLT